jgi:hypothetical protein
MDVSRRLRNITKAEAIDSYNKLKELDCNSIGKYSRIGLHTLDYFFLRHRIKAKTKRHISFSEALKDDNLMEYINGKIDKIKKVSVSQLTANEHLRQRYSVFQLYYGTINQFRPTDAKRIYCTLKPRYGVLDFSAGWGGRCLGAMAYGVPYVGIDANNKMEVSYKQMIATVDPNADVTMIFKPSETVNFSNINYDLVFTSPPYFMLEEYERMPQYGSKEGFLEKFFRPVVQSAWKNLKSPGHMALNMPKEMYDSVKHLLPPIWKRMKLHISNRHPTNAVTGKAIGDTDSKGRSEGIYIWKKGGHKTRKIRR